MLAYMKSLNKNENSKNNNEKVVPENNESVSKSKRGRKPSVVKNV